MNIFEFLGKKKVKKLKRRKVKKEKRIG